MSKRTQINIQVSSVLSHHRQRYDIQGVVTLFYFYFSCVQHFVIFVSFINITHTYIFINIIIFLKAVVDIIITLKSTK